jgi:SNF2 family DNA or RNA helicase
LGKSAITLGAIKILKKKKLLSKVLIIAPLRVAHNVWPGEIKKWADFSGLTIEVLHGNDKNKALERNADIYVINPEGLDWLLKTTKTKSVNGKKTSVSVDIKAFKKLGFDTLVIDELTRFKNQNAISFKALAQVHKTFGRRWGLTGSPAANGLLGLFGQAYILDEGNALGKFVTHYRSKYFDTVDNEGFVYAPKPGAPDLIYERLSPLVLRMAAEDYLDLPQLVYNTIKLEMPSKSRQHYDLMEEDLFMAIDDKAIVASNAAVASGKLRQIVGGAIYEDAELTAEGFKVGGRRDFIDLHTTKLDALGELVEELQGDPLLVAYDFGHELIRLRKRFPNAVFAADVPINKFKDLEDSWNRGEIPLLFGHPQSIGHGLNFQQAGNNVAWFSMTWNFELEEQFIARILRQGNKHKKVFVHRFIMVDTIDELMAYSLKAKAKGQGALFKALQDLAAKRKKRK